MYNPECLNILLNLQNVTHNIKSDIPAVRWSYR